MFNLTHTDSHVSVYLIDVCLGSSECDALSGVQAGVHGGGRDGKRLCEGLRGGSQQHGGEDNPGMGARERQKRHRVGAAL